MHKIILFLVLLSIGGCINTQQKKITTDTAVTVSTNIVDSLQTLLQKDSVLISILSAKIKQQKILITFTAEKCHRYALIVRRSPSQSIFIVGWIDRAFQWTKEKQ
jgi:hypothetical protein